jgi:hypothetical protein
MDEHDWLSPKEAAALAGLAPATLRRAAQAQEGKPARLRSVKFGHDRLATRRWLHAFLLSRDTSSRRVAPLPSSYVPQEGE